MKKIIQGKTLEYLPNPVHKYIYDGQELPSVTKILGIDFKYWEYENDAQDLAEEGTKSHEIAENDMPVEIPQYLREIFAKGEIKQEFKEDISASIKYKFAGKYDCLLEMESGEFILIDYKTSFKPIKKHFIQLWFYIQMLREEGINVTTSYIAMLEKTTGKFRNMVLNEEPEPIYEDYIRDYQEHKKVKDKLEHLQELEKQQEKAEINAKIYLNHPVVQAAKDLKTSIANAKKSISAKRNYYYPFGSYTVTPKEEIEFKGELTDELICEYSTKLSECAIEHILDHVEWDHYIDEDEAWNWDEDSIDYDQLYKDHPELFEKKTIYKGRVNWKKKPSKQK